MTKFPGDIVVDEQRPHLGRHKIDNETYHASVGISRSMLMRYKRSPYQYYCEYVAGELERGAVTPSVLLGEAVHRMALEPAVAADTIVKEPAGINKRTIKGKAEYSAFLHAHSDKLILPEQVFKTADVIATQLWLNNPIFSSIMKDAAIEESIYFEHKPTGLLCKVRPDIWNDVLVGDLKTTSDASYRAFQSSAMKYGYFLQSAMIKEALLTLDIKLEKFVFICVETNKPHRMVNYILDDEALDYGCMLFDSIMKRLAKSYDDDEWEQCETQTLCLPTYAMYEEI